MWDRSDFGVRGGEEALVGIGAGRWDWSLNVRRSGRSRVRMEDGGSALRIGDWKIGDFSFVSVDVCAWRALLSPVLCGSIVV